MKRARKPANGHAAEPGAKRSAGVRIIGGRLRGRRLPVPDVPGLRPTPDRVRETLFNWLAPHIAGMRVLDLFAGSGALGIEALSRGAASATLVEQSRSALGTLRETLQKLGVAEARLVAAEALTFVATDAGSYDLSSLTNTAKVLRFNSNSIDCVG